MTAGGQQPDFHALQDLLRHRRRGRPAKVESKDYLWQSPHRFMVSQHKQISEVTGRLCESISESLSNLLAIEVSLQTGEFDQHYASNLKPGMLKMTGYSLMLNSEANGEVGYIMLSPGKALGWVSKRLGVLAAPTPEVRTLSTLETNLLLDVFSSIRDSMASIAAGLAQIKCGQEIIENVPRMNVPGFDEFCRFTFAIPKEEGEPAVRIIIKSSLVESAFGIQTVKNGQSPADIRKCIMAHLGRVPVRLHAEAGRSLVPMEDIMDMAVGDVIPLDTRMSDSIRVMLRSHCIMKGWMSVSKNNYAVQISGPPGEDDK